LPSKTGLIYENPMAEGFTEQKKPAPMFFSYYFPVIFDGYYRNKNQKESRAFFKNGTPTLPDKHSVF
jgi:hypothetical protein